MSTQEKDCSLRDAEFLHSIIRWHKFRPWAVGASGEFATRCGDCGGDVSDHPYPLAHVNTIGQQRQLADAILALCPPRTENVDSPEGAS